MTPESHAVSQQAVSKDGGASIYIKEITAQNFMLEVIQASLQLPVLVYFTASWCKPCKQYGPTLEKVVKDSKGSVKLARVDIDKNPQLAQQFRIQSVPIVYIFVQGQPVDAIPGPLSESQLKQVIAQFAAPLPEEESRQATLEIANQLLAENNLKDAEECFAAMYAEDGSNIDALAGLARCYIATGRLTEAETLLATVPKESQNHETVAIANASLALAKTIKPSDMAVLESALKTDPLNHAIRYDLASNLFLNARPAEAIAELLHIIAKDRDWNEGEARRRLLTIFEALGAVHPATLQGRRKLSSILFS